ncbi:MAG: hypothetical protein ACRDRJ_22020 [Streptosporangiaceae bacterium]
MVAHQVGHPGGGVASQSHDALDVQAVADQVAERATAFTRSSISDQGACRRISSVIGSLGSGGTPVS